MTRTCVTAAGLYCGYGMSIPIAPVAAGLVGVILVRAILWSKDQSLIWNAAVLGLCSMATFVTLEGSDASTFFGFWTGVGYGAIGVGIIALSKNMMKGALAERFKAAGEIIFGIKSSEPRDPPIQ